MWGDKTVTFELEKCLFEFIVLNLFTFSLLYRSFSLVKIYFFNLLSLQDNILQKSPLRSRAALSWQINERYFHKK